MAAILGATAPLNTMEVAAADDVPIMVYGTSRLVVDIDPHYCWDSASTNMIEQIMEGLFCYDLTDTNLAYVPCLAKDYGTWEEGDDGFHGKQWKYTVDLKSNITFHDNTTFEADDVKYSFDRLNTLCTTGANGAPTQIASLYMPLALTYPVTPLLINETKIIDADTIELILNYKYAALESLLCFTGSVIMPKDEYPVDAYMDKSTDVLIGTGPYKQVSNTVDLTEFEYFDDFRGAYGVEQPDIQKMVYKLYHDATVLNQAFLAGDIDAIDRINLEFMAQYETSDLHVVGDRMQGVSIAYIGFDMGKVDINTRKALLSAINYAYALEELGKGEREQLNSLVPEGILYHDWNAPTPVMDLVKARASMADAIDASEQGIVEPANWATLETSTNDEDWEAVTILTIDYSYNEGNDYRRDVGVLCKADFAKIGVQLNIQGLQWEAYLTALNSGEMEMYTLGWGPDFNDPSNYIDNLAGSASRSNNAHVNDPVLDDLISQGLIETDPVKREALYIQMQKRINEISVFGYLSISNARSVYSVDYQNTARNAMDKLYFYLWNNQKGLDYYGSVIPTTTSTSTTNTTTNSTNTSTDPTNNTDDSPFADFLNSIPGFNVVTLLAVCSISLFAIMYKKRF